MTSIMTDLGPLNEPSVQDWLAHFDHLPDEFGRLRKEVHGVIRFLDRAAQADEEERAHLAKSALGQSLMALEVLLQDVYKHRFGEPHGNRMVDELISRLSKEEQLPPEIQAAAQYVRTLGNSGSHPREQPSTMAQGRQALTHLMPILDWYVKAKQSGALDLPPLKSSAETPRPTARFAPRLTIVHKGLQSYNAGDAEFFLKLLPGRPHDGGLPESIHFWKHRIETQDENERDFTFGVIYGPSGCGKSSLVKAGLLPNLDKRVVPVYLEATADGTESRLLDRLRTRFPKLGFDLRLMRTVRDESGIPTKGKNLVVVAVVDEMLHFRIFDAQGKQVLDKDERELPQRACEIEQLKRQLKDLRDVKELPKSDKDRVISSVTTIASHTPKLPPGHDLVQTIAALWREDQRRTLELSENQKVILVIDQFEQWLHAHRGERNSTLAQALRQCDGERVQAVVTVREDFLAAMAEFMGDLEIHLAEGKNCLRVELFDLDHAKTVLSAFGQFFEQLPKEPSPEQNVFLDEAVQGLAREHRIVPVRLALFAQMVQKKPWTPQTLKTVGGTEGVGPTFLEETFCTESANPTYRHHQQGAIAVLRALLPEDETDIKGRERSYDELLAASGYRNREAFAELLRILDSDLRLISPASHDLASFTGSAPDPALSATDPATRFYQLTHDYLVTALRKWLDRKLQESNRGKAEKLLASRAATWKGKSEDRYLPSLREHFDIRRWTNRSQWTTDQRAMMHRVSQVHRRQVGLFLVALVLLGAFGWGLVEARNAQHAEDLVQKLVAADIAKVPEAIKDLDQCRSWANPMLWKKWTTLEPKSEERLKVALGLLPVAPDPVLVDYLFDQLLDSKPDTFPTIRDQLSLSGQSAKLVEPLWNVLENPNVPENPEKWSQRRFQAACALAAYTTKADPADAAARWERSAPFVADEMITTIVDNPRDYGAVLSILKPASRHLIGPLSTAFQDPKKSYHTLYAAILAEYALDQPERIAGLIADARDPNAFKKLFDSLTSAGRPPVEMVAAELDRTFPPAQIETAAQHRANAAVALLRLDAPARVWPLLKYSPDPRVRSYIIHRQKDLGVDPRWYVAHWDDQPDMDDQPDVDVRQALMLALGEFKLTQLPPEARRPLLDKIGTLYREADDPGLHSTAEWLLREWGQTDRLVPIDRKPAEGRRWYVNSQGQTMVVMPPGKYKAGSARYDPPDAEGIKVEQHEVVIDHTFAIDAHEVTFDEFSRFRKPVLDEQSDKALKPQSELDPNPRCPIINLTWYEAAAYCNWLSEKEHLEPCYEPKPNGEFADGMRTVPRYLERTGYRLPTEVEWEYACRAGTSTPRYYGQAPELLERYAWFEANAKKTLWPVGSLRPNALGLFDMLGNAIEWCQDAHHEQPTAAGTLDDAVVINSVKRVRRGEKLLSKPENVIAAKRDFKHNPNQRDFIDGFRVARTLRP